MNWEEFTRCFVETVEEEALEKFGDHSKFAREAWPDHKNPPVLWRTIRNGRSKTGVRDIYTKDMIGMANALNERLSSLIFATEEKIRKGWIPKDSQLHFRSESIRKKYEENTHGQGNNTGKNVA